MMRSSPEKERNSNLKFGRITVITNVSFQGDRGFNSSFHFRVLSWLQNTGEWAASGQMMVLPSRITCCIRPFRKLSTLNLFLEASTISSGCHPGSNVSLVSGVGTVSKKLLTETIARIFHLSRAASLPVCAPTFPRVGGLPFLWGQNEYVINVSGYVFVNGSMSEDASKFCRVLSDRDAPKIGRLADHACA